MAKKKNRIDVVYSTNPNFDFNHEEDDENETLPPDQQDLLVHIDRKQRKGKEVTLVTGFIGTEDDLKELGKTLKQKCGTGGTVKKGEIIIQGNNLKKVLELLQAMDYNARQSGGG